MKRTLIFLFLCATALHAQDAALAPPSPLRIGGFADIVLRTAPTNTVWNAAELDLYSTLRLSTDWSALAEGMVQRAWRPVEASEKPELDLRLERLYFSYQRSDAFRLEIGETHTGIIRWNEREHRSRFLQTPIEVPAIARYPQDDGAWPTRFVGLWASGERHDAIGFKWEAGAGAGPGANRDVIPILSDDLAPAAFFSMSFSPRAVEGFEAGFAAYGQHVPSEPRSMRERDVTLFSDYVNHGTEIRAELARLNQTPSHTDRTFRNQGWYVLISKRLTGSAERARPYLLLDHLNVDPADVFLQDAKNENAWAAGVRYDFTQRFTAKGEFRSQRAPDGGRRSIFGMQLGFSF